MRKFVLGLVALMGMVGLLGAVEVVMEKDGYDKDKKELKVKEGDATKTYKITDKTKFTVTDQKGENAKDSDYAAFEKRATGKVGKNGQRYEIEAEKDTITKVTWKAGKT